MSRMFKNKVGFSDHLQLGDPHQELDVLHGIELLDLERFFPLMSVNGDVEFLQRGKISAWRTQDY